MYLSLLLHCRVHGTQLSIRLNGTFSCDQHSLLSQAAKEGLHNVLRDGEHWGS